MWKLKRFATYSLELELSTRSTNDKKQDFCKSWLLEERTSSGTQLGCLSKILISFPYLISWECVLLADGCDWGLQFLARTTMCIVSNGCILLPRKQALSNDCIAIRVLNKRCNSCASAVLLYRWRSDSSGITNQMLQIYSGVWLAGCLGYLT